jgi:acetylornithine deacetylase/succinyl-diaminopimelate desuccinylase-like protein
MPNNNTAAYVATNKSRFIEELISFLSIPSVSAQPDHRSDIQQAAQFVKDQLLAAGADQAYLINTMGNPLVYGDKMVDPQLPTVLVYGHYDVQPAEPFERWHSEPFKPSIKDNNIFARGASDDKGQVYIHVKALETMVALKSLPCNIKFIIEGEEEIGSKAISKFLEDPANHALLEADVILVSDTTILSIDQPSLTTGLRGITHLELTLTGPNRDLHSGVYGGAVANPIHILCQMIAALHDKDQRITIPGFYDKVANLTAAERAELNKTPFDLQAYQQDLGIETVIGEKGYSTLERVGVRPSLSVNGIWGGYTGAGTKTVLPSQAHAKITIRLVPDQDPSKVIESLSQYLTSLAPQGTRLEIERALQGYKAVVLNEDSIAFQAAQKAFEEVWGKSPLSIKEGGSIPIITKFKEQLGTDVVLLGFGLDSDAIHSPNEHFSLITFEKGISTVISFYEHLAKLCR